MTDRCPRCRDHGKTERHADHSPCRDRGPRHFPYPPPPKTPRPHLTPAQRRAAVLLGYAYVPDNPKD